MPLLFLKMQIMQRRTVRWIRTTRVGELPHIHVLSELTNQWSVYWVWWYSLSQA